MWTWREMSTARLGQGRRVRRWITSDGSWGGASGLSTTLSRLTRNGARVSTGLALDLAHLVTSGGHSSFGILADTSINVPLLSGAGEAVVGESLTQAERSLRYALFRLERFRQSLALRTASEFLDVLQLRDRVQNAERNHLSLVTAAKRADALAEAGRVPAIAVDEARQDELRARDRLVVARQSFASRLDRFKTTLGLPPDAEISLDHDELKNLLRPIREALLVAEGMKPQSEAEMIEVGLRKRLDLRTSQLRVEDEERQEKIAGRIERGRVWRWWLRVARADGAVVLGQARWPMPGWILLPVAIAWAWTEIFHGRRQRRHTRIGVLRCRWNRPGGAMRIWRIRSSWACATRFANCSRHAKAPAFRLKRCAWHSAESIIQRCSWRRGVRRCETSCSHRRRFSRPRTS